MPAVSVLVGLPGRADDLGATLASVRAQTLGDVECLLVGDTVVADPCVTSIAAPGLDPVARLNLALMRASAPLVALIGPGAVADPHWLETLAGFMAIGRCVAVGCGHREEGTGTCPTVHLPPDAGLVDGAAIPPKWGGMPLDLALLDRDALLAAGGFRACPEAGDVELARRLAWRGPVWNLPETLGRLPAVPRPAEALRLRAVSAQRLVLGLEPLDPAAAPGAAEGLEAVVAIGCAGLEEEARWRVAHGAALGLIAESRRLGVTVEDRDRDFIRAELARDRRQLSVRDADQAAALLRGVTAMPAPFEPDTTTITYNGIRLAVEPGVLAGRLGDAMLGGWYEQEESRHVPGLLRAGERVVELGSGLGYVTTVMARSPLVEAVVTVEANPQLARLAARTVALNGLSDKVSVENAVAFPSPAMTSCRFYVRREFWASSLDAGDAYLQAIDVPVLDLDRLIEDVRPTLLVVDIEGGEVELLERVNLGGIRKVFLELHQGVIGREGMRRVFATMAARYFHYDQYHSEGSVVLFSRVDRQD